VDFDTYMRVRGSALLRFAYLLTGSRQDAEDLAQTALEDALIHWGKVTRAEHPDRYVERMITNRFLQGRRRRSATELVTDRSWADQASPGDTTAEIVDRDQIKRLLADLPPRVRAVLVLRYYLELDDEAIASMIGSAPGTVRSIANRGLGSLRLHVPHPTER
jgi:RNA polymerase sigma-70 factor (sigma-E family)